MQLVPPLDAIVQPYVLLAQINFMSHRAKNTRRAALHTLTTVCCLSEPPTTFIIVYQHFIQHVPPLDAIVLPYVLLVRIILCTGETLKLRHYRQLCTYLNHYVMPFLSYPPSLFSIAYQHLCLSSGCNDPAVATLLARTELILRARINVR